MAAVDLGANANQGRLAQETAWRQMYDDAGTPALFNASALPASGAWRRSETLFVGGMRRFGLWVFADADASGGTGAYPQIIVLGSAASTEPAAGADSWTMLPVLTGTVASTAFGSGTVATGADYTLTPAGNMDTAAPLIVQLRTLAADTDKIRVGPLSYNVELVRWVHVIAAEVGDTTNPVTLNLYANCCS